MRGMFAIAAAVVGFGAIAAWAADPSGRPDADRPTPLSAQSLSETTSSNLARSGGVITPPAGVDPQMKRMPSHSADPMLVIPHRARPAATHRSSQSSRIRCRIGTLGGRAQILGV